MKKIEATDSEQIVTLREIRTGVCIVLWVVLTQALVWPIGAIISGSLDEPLLSYRVMSWAAVVSVIVSFAIARFTFPISLPSNEPTSAAE